jgi:hypothetical protein
MYIVRWEKRWVIRESSNGRLRSSILQFSSARAMLTHITISVRRNSIVVTRRRLFRNSKLLCDYRRKARTSTKNWLMHTRLLCER